MFGNIVRIKASIMLKINRLTSVKTVFAFSFLTLFFVGCSQKTDLPKYIPDDSNTDLPSYLYEDQMRPAETAKAEDDN